MYHGCLVFSPAVLPCPARARTATIPLLSYPLPPRSVPGCANVQYTFLSIPSFISCGHRPIEAAGRRRRVRRRGEQATIRRDYQVSTVATPEEHPFCSASVFVRDSALSLLNSVPTACALCVCGSRSPSMMRQIQLRVWIVRSGTIASCHSLSDYSWSYRLTAS